MPAGLHGNLLLRETKQRTAEQRSGGTLHADRQSSTKQISRIFHVIIYSYCYSNMLEKIEIMNCKLQTSGEYAIGPSDEADFRSENNAKNRKNRQFSSSAGH